VAARAALPVEAVLDALRGALRERGRAVLQAPPGAGKSTLVPLALLEEPWARGQRILLQEPRRLAARAVAERMASLSGGAVGGLVGLRMRFDTRVSGATRIEVVTEGILTRMLQRDPALEGVAAILFDEFHERSLASDLALALALDAEAQLGPRLRLLVMSATLDGERVAALLGDAPLITSAGRRFPVEVRHAGRGAPLLPGGSAPAERALAQLTLRALREEHGDLLVFLPGAGEIRRVESMLRAAPDAAGVDLRPLHGELAPGAQAQALSPGTRGRRRVVLATNIAETSLTIEGVRVVIDSGLVRRSAFDPATGMSRLETERISRASAEQRAGRAGRLEPGVCYRAWSEEAGRSLAAFTPPEIVAADLAPLALDLAAWGVSDAAALRWLDPPPAAMLGSARELLRRLGALDADGRLTVAGREMAELPVHPRLAHLLWRAAGSPALRLAAELAALLSERDLLRGTARDADIASRVAALRGGGGERDEPGVDRDARERVRRMAVQFERLMAPRARRESAARGAADAADCGQGGQGGGIATAGGNGLSEGVLLGFAYPDRIARRRHGGDGRYTLANGRGAVFAEPDRLAGEEFIVAIDLDDRDRDARIRLAAGLARSDLLQHFADRLRTVEEVVWDERDEAVTARRRVVLGALTVDERALRDVDAALAVAAMLEGVRRLGLGALPWDGAARALQARIRFVRGLAGETPGAWPDVADATLLATLDHWLAPWLNGITRRAQLARIPLAAALLALLDPRAQQRLAKLAPELLTVASGSRLRIDYEGAHAPSVAVRLQEVFGEPESPRVGGGAVPVTFTLLSPAQRPLQITRDLASFWRNAYLEVRKDMRGRYPRHHWPENPLEAAPSRRPRRPRPS
jgi:ATP-dependent helicase HrpB